MYYLLTLFHFRNFNRKMEVCDKTLSPFELLKSQVRNHEALIVLRCCIALSGSSKAEPASTSELFGRVQKHVNIICFEVFRNILESKCKIFGSADKWETVYLQEGIQCKLLKELLAYVPKAVVKVEPLAAFPKSLETPKFMLKTNKNSLDFSNLLGQYSLTDQTFCPKFQSQGQHYCLPMAVPGNRTYRDGDWLLVSLRFGRNPSQQFSCEIHSAEVVSGTRESCSQPAGNGSGGNQAD